MKLRFLTVVLLLLSVSAFAAEPVEPATDDKTDATKWETESAGKDLSLQSRRREASALKEFRAIGLIAAPTESVFAVLDDSEAYPSFMPYTAECRILKRDREGVVVYQRLKLPLLSDRDYTLRTHHEVSPGTAGATYRIRWETANDLGPVAKSGVMRVKLCEGGWLLEPDGPNATRATYTVYTDSGGAVPKFIAEKGSRIAIRKIFDAIRKQVKEPRYAETAAKPNE